ncbi:hypothetical protein HKX48_001663 [Thoreauomyces humboldtii]|nr:hypothetical protein HKX48_001663 [Thoreauomyces humboldtii]
MLTRLAAKQLAHFQAVGRELETFWKPDGFCYMIRKDFCVASNRLTDSLDNLSNTIADLKNANSEEKIQPITKDMLAFLDSVQVLYGLFMEERMRLVIDRKYFFEHFYENEGRLPTRDDMERSGLLQALEEEVDYKVFYKPQFMALRTRLLSTPLSFGRDLPSALVRSAIVDLYCMISLHRLMLKTFGEKLLSALP